MNVLSLIVFIVLILPGLSLAEHRSIFDKIYGPDLMEEHQLLEQNKHGDALELFSPHLGQKLNTETHRSLVLIENIDDLNELPAPVIQRVKKVLGNKRIEQYHILANFFHTSPYNTEVNEHYVAIVPKDIKLGDIHFEQFLNSNKIIVKSQLRIQTKGTIILIPQESEDYPAIPMGPTHLVYSLARVQRENTSGTFQIVNAITGGYGFALTLSSEASLMRPAEMGLELKQFQIGKIAPEQTSQIFNRILKDSDTNQEFGIYNLSHNNDLFYMLSALSAANSDLELQLTNPHLAYQRIKSAFPGATRINGSRFDMDPLAFLKSNGSQKFYETLEKISEVVLRDKNIQIQLLQISEEEGLRVPSTERKTSDYENIKTLLMGQGVSESEFDDFIKFLPTFEAQGL